MKRSVFLLLTLFFVSTAHAAGIADFEDLTLAPESNWHGADGSGGFDSRGVHFNNSFTDWGGGFYAWDGFSYSNMTDTGTVGYAGQYNAITGEGANGSSNYSVSYVDTWAASPPTVTLPEESICDGMYVTNNNYAYYSMKDGDAFAKKFEEGDWFRLTVTGKDAGGNVTGTVQTFLAVGTDILDSWQWVSLRPLGKIKTLEFALASTDNGQWGMNTPAYFCMDNLVYGMDPASVPTMSEWGMIVFALLTVLCAVMVIRKRGESL